MDAKKYLKKNQYELFDLFKVQLNLCFRKNIVFIVENFVAQKLSFNLIYYLPTSQSSRPWKDVIKKLQALFQFLFFCANQ